jgi:hypothetical protein
LLSTRRKAKTQECCWVSVGITHSKQDWFDLWPRTAKRQL